MQPTPTISRPGHDAAASGPTRRAGFTLIELLVVVGILALAAQMVVMNLGAMIPRTRLDTAARQMMSELEYLRLESKLQGKSYALELDFEGDRYRVIVPPEERTLSDQVIDEFGVELTWTNLETEVDLVEVVPSLGPAIRKDRYRLTFDEHGFTADQVVVLKMKNPDLDEMVWTIQVRGLQRRTELVTSFDGNVAILETVDEASGF